MKFKYMEYGDTLRPVIPVNLSWDGKSINYEVFGIGGNISMFYTHKLTLTVGDISNEIEAGFVPKIGGGIVPCGIVGQKGFFDKFVIKFDLLKEEVELKERRQ